MTQLSFTIDLLIAPLVGFRPPRLSFSHPSRPFEPDSSSGVSPFRFQDTVPGRQARHGLACAVKVRSLRMVSRWHRQRM